MRCWQWFWNRVEQLSLPTAFRASGIFFLSPRTYAGLKLARSLRITSPCSYWLSHLQYAACLIVRGSQQLWKRFPGSISSGPQQQKRRASAETRQDIAFASKHISIGQADIQKGLWRNGSASDSRSEGWEFESLWPQVMKPMTFIIHPG